MFGSEPFWVTPTSWQSDAEAILRLRATCFVPDVLQGIHTESDRTARHAIAWAADICIGSARLTAGNQIELVCTELHWRRLGVARALVQSLLDTAKELGARSASCQAIDSVLQAALIRWGFQPSNADATWLGWIFPISAPLIRQVDVNAQSATEQSLPALLQSKLIGGKTRAELQSAALQVAQHAKRELIAYTDDLDPAIFNQASMLELLRKLALRPRAKLRFLVQRPQRASQTDHRLIELSRTLPSMIAIRQVQDDDLTYHSAFLANDQFGFLLRDPMDRFECEGNLYDIGQHGKLKRYFEEVWERSGPVLEFRRLG